MKKIIILTFILLACVTISVSATTINVDGRDVDFVAYNIDDNNYIRLCDLAIVLTDSNARFDVTLYDNSVLITPDTAYTGEIDIVEKTDKTPEITHAYIPVFSGTDRAYAKAYDVDGYTYFKLRDIAKIVDFGVFWSADTGIKIDSSRGYYLTEDEEKALYIEYANRRHGEFVKQNEDKNEDKKYYVFADVDRDGRKELAVKKGYGITLYKIIDGEVQRMYCDPLPESTGEIQYHYVTYDGDDCIAYITKERIMLYILSGDSLLPLAELKPDEIDQITFPKRYTLEEIKNF